jgi:methylenetetrahydrofolate reductase (NADPH)
MKVVEHLERAPEPPISFEIIPPLRGGTVRGVLELMDELMRYRPPFIDITSHAAEISYEDTDDGIQRRIKRKRPGTMGVCALIQNKYQVDAVPHVLCHGFTREETEDFLIELRYLGIDNVLAIRGDDSGYQKPLRGRTANDHACDLVHQIAGMNRGHYLGADLVDAEPADFCVGVAGYPEKHFEAPNLDIDIRHTREKIDAGASYVVTQMFFDNAAYFAYVERCRAAGIRAPIIPGLKVLSSRRQVSSIPSHFYVDLPTAFADELATVSDERVLDVGVEWALGQVRELLDRGAPSLHFYIMQSAKGVQRVLDKLRLGTFAS